MNAQEPKSTAACVKSASEGERIDNKVQLPQPRTEDEGKFKGPTFYPPVYRRRYAAVGALVRKYQAKKVVDFGCAEGKLVRYLINEETLTHMEVLIGVDIDRDLLEQNKFRIQPLTTDYLRRRSHPFKVGLYQGSIAEADERFLDIDLCACIEIIEHLEAEVLDAMPKAVFGQLTPQVVIVTTPNVEFNVLFPDLQGFRHWDHKFEWTRAEFEEWANIQASTYGYTVKFDGIAPGPEGTEHLGCCSQVAVFERMSSSDDCLTNSGIGQPYNLIAEVEHPFRKDNSTKEEKILKEVEYVLWVLSAIETECDDISEGSNYDNKDDDDDNYDDDDNDDDQNRFCTDCRDSNMKGDVSEGSNCDNKDDDDDDGQNRFCTNCRYSNMKDDVSEGSHCDNKDDDADDGQSRFCTDCRDSNVKDDGAQLYSFEKLLSFVSLRKLCDNVESLRYVLEASSMFNLSEDGCGVVWCRPSLWSSDDSDTEWEKNNADDSFIDVKTSNTTEPSAKDPENWDEHWGENCTQTDWCSSSKGETDVCWDTSNSDSCKFWNGEDWNEVDDNTAQSVDEEEPLTKFSCSRSQPAVQDLSDGSLDIDSDDNDDLLWITADSEISVENT